MEYRIFESILAELHQVDEADLKAFRSRLRILRDVGVPKVQRPGKGSRVAYHPRDVWMGHLGLILDDAGLPPSVVADVARNLDDVGVIGLYREMVAKYQEDIWIMFAVNIRSKNTQDKITTWLAKSDDVGAFFSDAAEPLRSNKFRIARFFGTVNLSEVQRNCDHTVAKYEE